MNKMLEFTRIMGEVDTLYHEASFRLGLSDSEMSVLYILLSNGKECDISYICKMSGAKKQTINSALRNLEANGYIKIEIYSHKKRLVCLTKQGKDYAYATAGVLMNIEKQVFQNWTQEEMDYYISLSMRFLDNFKDISDKELFNKEKL